MWPSSFLNFSMISASVAKFFSLPREGINGSLHHRPILHANVHADRVAVLIARGRDLRVVDHFHSFRQCHTCRICDDLFRELVDEDVPLEQESRDAKGQAELCRRNPLQVQGLPA